MKVYKSIMTQEITYPRSFQTKNIPAKAFLAEILVKNPARRLKLEQVRKNPWYRSFNWDELMMKQMVPSYKPEVKAIDVKRSLPGTV